MVLLYYWKELSIGKGVVRIQFSLVRHNSLALGNETSPVFHGIQSKYSCSSYVKQLVRSWL